MGWFDDEDSSDEEEKKQQTATGVSDIQQAEDPLDAYMNALQADVSSAPRPERLDIQQEEENDEESTRGEEESKQDTAPQLFVPPECWKESVFKVPFSPLPDSNEAQSWRKANLVKVMGHACPPAPLLSVQTPPLQTLTLPSTPTSIQAQSWPLLLEGCSVRLTSATGQGKTLAYAVPAALHALHQASPTTILPSPSVLVLVPTRELALQIHKVFESLTNHDFVTKAVLGGQGTYKLRQEWKHYKSTLPLVVVATPGRLLDLCSRTKPVLSLNHVSMFILDEVDRLLQQGFGEQLRQIQSRIRPDVQKVQVSATWSRRMQERFGNDLVRVSVGRTGASSAHVDQQVVCVPGMDEKISWLRELLPVLQQVGRTLVFVATRDGCERLKNSLPTDTLIETLHGDKHQATRVAALKTFTKMEGSILIATDVAARGLDISNVTSVVNYDPPKNWDTYVHRIGRAGRLSQEDDQQLGTAYTLLTDADASFANTLKSVWERDGRLIPDDLEGVASSNRKRPR